MEMNRRMGRLEKMLEVILEKEGLRRDANDDDTESLLSENESDTMDASDDENYRRDEKNGALGYLAHDDPRDVMTINRRRIPILVKFGGLESIVTSTYGFTSSLLSPKSLRWLCERMGLPNIGEEAEMIVVKLWRRRTEIIMGVGNFNLHSVPLDPELLECGFEIRERIDSGIFRILIEDEDVHQIQRLCNPENDLNRLIDESPHSIFYAAHVLLATSIGTKVGYDMSKFSQKHLEQQHKNAFNLCKKKVSQMVWYPSTFLSLRMLVFVAYVMEHSAPFPLMRCLLAVTISRALAVGLDRSESGMYFSGTERMRRSMVWSMIHDLDIKLSSLVSTMPMLLESIDRHDQIIAESPYEDIRILLENKEFNRIYSEAYAKLFSMKARKMTIKQMLLTVVRLDQKLVGWKNSLPVSFTQMSEIEKFNSQRMGSQDRRNPPNKNASHEPKIYFEWMKLSSIVRFYTLRMLLYSIPAFSPSSLSVFDTDPEGVPPELQKSLDTIGDCANACLKYVFMGITLSNPEFSYLSATNAFSALFLKQVRDPRHPTNKDDLIGLIDRIEQFKTIHREYYYNYENVVLLWDMLVRVLNQLNSRTLANDTETKRRKTDVSQDRVSKGATSVQDASPWVDTPISNHHKNSHSMARDQENRLAGSAPESHIPSVVLPGSQCNGQTPQCQLEPDATHLQQGPAQLLQYDQSSSQFHGEGNFYSRPDQQQQVNIDGLSSDLWDTFNSLRSSNADNFLDMPFQDDSQFAFPDDGEGNCSIS